MTDERRCGECQLCCKLVPVKELGKVAGKRCQYQKALKGCRVYHRPDKGFPPSCGLWNCAWLGAGEGTEDLSRPDRVHYVIDVMPDFVTVVKDDGERVDVPVIQVWIDPAFPDAHRDPGLRAYIKRRAEKEGAAALIRSDSEKAFVLVAPNLSQTGDWYEHHTSVTVKEHSLADVAERFGLKAEFAER